MTSLKFTIFLMVALTYITIIRTDDDERKISDTEVKGLFDDLKEKVTETFDRALEKSKETFKITEDAVSNHFNILKEKGKELIKDQAENLASVPA